MPEFVRENGILVPQAYATPAIPAMPEGGPREFLAPLVEQWEKNLDLAIEAKQPFNDIAYQCDSFFARSSGFMWSDKYRNKFLGPAIKAPKWQVTLNKAFELVALFGPYLFWKYPQVFITSYEPLELTPDLFGDPEDPGVQQMFQQASSEVQSDVSRQNMRNQLMERYLNYSQKEQPGGGLATHAEIAITEALVKGRGVLTIEGYKFPGSGRNLTMRRYRSVDDLLIDPDSHDPLLGDAKWIAIRHDDADWEVERKFNLPRGYLKNRGAHESNESLAANRSDAARRNRVDGQSHDRVVWHEIWSKGGVGTRLSHSDNPSRTMIGSRLHDQFDDVVGDYAYLCIAHNIPFPLNAPSWKFRDPQTNDPIADDDEVAEMFQWRCAGYGPEFPCYMDDRWPVVLLDFYKTYGSCWPIAPLAPALGELTVLNVLISAFTEQAYENRKTVIAYLASATKSVEKALRSSDNPAFVEINDSAHKKIDEIIQYLKRPEMNKDLLEAIAFVSNMFDKRSGLTEFMYAMTTTQSRSARDVAAKEEKAAIRPEKMSQDVAAWLTESAELEKFLAGWTIDGNDLLPLLGRYGVYFWDQLIVAEDPEVVVREMKATIEANDIRKPNRDRLLANIQEMLQYFLPMTQQYAIDTGDTQPLNEFLENLNRAMEDDIAPQFGQWQQQPPSEEEMQMQQMQMQLEQAKLQAEVTIKQIEAQSKQVDLQKAQVELQTQAMTGGVDVTAKQLELDFDSASHDQELDQSDEKHDQLMGQDRIKFLQDMLQQREEARIKIQTMKTEASIKAKSGNGKPARSSA